METYGIQLISKIKSIKFGLKFRFEKIQELKLRVHCSIIRFKFLKNFRIFILINIIYILTQVKGSFTTRMMKYKTLITSGLGQEIDQKQQI